MRPCRKHETRGKAINAFVLIREGSHLSQEEVIDFCRGKLATCKLAVSMEVRDVLHKSKGP